MEVEIDTINEPDGYEHICKNCGCEVEWYRCPDCDNEGYSHHDCGEDTCCCLNPTNNIPCSTCDGMAGWYNCVNCDKEDSYNKS